ncbi:hypothetical protein PITC_033380 [Penicillium italicum]|uniref:Rhodopsin domain-containing protein n=1 Tax=Penicillium italicum TaxID=40296 RepID=A0A0A2L720_PENIT|nr:hypothetical protein PITC_033380 [Penicillium italicum]
MSSDPLAIETFTEYGIGMVFLLVRLYARLHIGGLRGLRLDDVFAVSAMIFWTMQTVIIHLLEVYGNNIGLNEQTAMLVPDDKMSVMILGSKLAFTNWIWYICYIWCLKGVLICLYWKLTSDAFMILIPIPILAKLQIAPQRKIILVVMFSSGIFIMICTILRAYYSLSSITNLGTALGWADRECFVAAIVVSLPGIKPLFRNTRWLGSSGRKDSKSPYYNSDAYNGTGSNGGKTKTLVSSRSRKSGGFELDGVLNTNKGSRISDAGSEEYILEGSQGVAAGARNRDPIAIHVTTEYTLEHEQGR